MTAFPEIPLADADPRTLAVYRKLMTAAGSGSPALIFRHMATYPGLLEWIWAAVARETVGHMLTSYNRMNPVNLVAVGAARALIAGDDAPPPATPFSEAPSTPPAAPPDLPPPLKHGGIGDGLTARIAAICRTIPRPEIGGAPVDVTPTMYRHFAIWPDFMHRVADRLDAALPEIDAETHAFAAACRPLIGQLLAKARTRDPGILPLDDPGDLLNVLDAFAYVIPHMVVVGEALEAALSK